MAGTYGQSDYVPPAPAADFKRLFVNGVEITPGAGGKVMSNIKAIDIKKEVDTLALAKTINSLLYELKQAGLMSDK